jgi:TIGR03009 family protein
MDMRHFGLACLAFFLVTVSLSAQNPTPAPSGQPPEGRLDLLLNAWEKRMSTVDQFSTKITRTNVHALTKKSSIYMGEAAFMKPDMARIDMTPQDEVGKKDNEKTNFERMLFNGKYLYEYSAQDKKIIIHDVPKVDPANENVLLAFLRGMKADDAKRRFNITLTKESEWYAYIYITPKNKADQQEFVAAQLTIFVKNPNPGNAPNLVMMPCRLWYRLANGNEITYMFSDMQPNGNVRKESFVPTQVPGFTVERAQQPAVPPPATPQQPAPKNPPK